MKPKQLPEFDCTVAVPPLILCSIPLCLCRGGGVADIDFTHPHTFQDGPGPDHTFFSAAVALPGPSSWKMETFRVGYQLQNVFCHHFFMVFSWPRAISGIYKIYWVVCPKSETPLVSCLAPLESSVTQQEQIASCRDEWESETPHPEMGNMSTLHVYIDIDIDIQIAVRST